MLRGRLAFQDATRTAAQLARVLDVHVPSSAGYVFRGRQYKTPEEMLVALKQSAGESTPPVRIATDPRVPFSRVLELFEVLVKAGFKNVAIVRSAPAEPTSRPAGGAGTASDRAVVATLLAEAETLRKDQPKQWARWDEAVADILARRAALVKNWGFHMPPPPADVAPLKLPLAYLVWRWREFREGLRGYCYGIGLEFSVYDYPFSKDIQRFNTDIPPLVHPEF